MKYSQWKAFKALVLAALRSLAKSPSSVIFTVAFPLVFIFGFGFLSSDEVQAIKIGVVASDDFPSEVWNKMQADSLLDLVPIERAATDSMLANAEVSGVLERRNNDFVWTGSSSAQKESELAFRMVSKHLRNAEMQPVLREEIAVAPIQKIGFVLTGQLGFSLLAASIFGVAFVFFGLRQQLVLKRFFATPIRRWNILLAEGTARMIFQLAGAAFLILAGVYFFDFKLIEGTATFFKLMILSGISVLVFMSFGFIISGLARAISTVPPLANIIVLPQFILAGTLFPVTDFPAWLQFISNLLPLTHLNNALRKVALQGAGIFDLGLELMVLFVWGIIGYAVASRLFKWE